MELDATDRRILELLGQDARASFRDMARALRLSPSTILMRVRKMQEEGVLKGFVPLIDLKKLGYGVTVAISVKARGGRLEEVEKEIAQLPNVMAVYDITGEWDVLVLAKFRDMSELNAFVKRLLSNPSIEHTLTSTVLNCVKEDIAARPEMLKGML
ncbi:MAG: Lrp/AsnC family transcriptional regulator [Candidatus Micrarchaeia archaeon]